MANDTWEQLALPDTRRCTKCGNTKALTDFSPRGKGRIGVQAWCKVCMSAYSTIRAAREVRDRLGLPHDAPKMQGRRWSHPEGSSFVDKRTGYVMQKASGHHRADKHGWVFAHLLVAEAKYGFPITRDFTVHHRNGDREDNRPENLELRYGNHGKGADVLPALLRLPNMRAVARTVLAEYDD